VRPLARGGGHPSRTAVAGSLVRSTREHRAGRPRSLAQRTAGSPLDLAPGGVYRAAAVTCSAGGLLHRRFTLTPRTRRGAVCFLWHCPAGHPGSALPITLPYGARTFLTRPAPGATARPTHPCSGYAEPRRPGVADRPLGTRVAQGLARGADVFAALAGLAATRTSSGRSCERFIRASSRRAGYPAGQQWGFGRMALAKAPRVVGPTLPHCASPPNVLPLRTLPNSQAHAPPTRARVQYG
jgi:hypothetical protein